MTAKKKTPTKMLKNLLTTGSIESEGKNLVEQPEQQVEISIQDDKKENQVPIEEPIKTEMIPETAPQEPITTPEPAVVKEEPSEQLVATSVQDVKETTPANEMKTTVEEEIEELKNEISQLKSQNVEYMTSKEQHKNYMDAMTKRDVELANKKLTNMLEQMCIMREDFLKLCSDMEKKIDKFSSKDILESFSAYSTDMENILIDAGVRIGKSDCTRLNTLHQRIIDVMPTDDEQQNGIIAERLSSEYEFNGRVLFKEKVKIYKFTVNAQSTSNNKEE
jgi:molecular chaperone GrpE (heat shock protein)